MKLRVKKQYPGGPAIGATFHSEDKVYNEKWKEFFEEVKEPLFTTMDNVPLHLEDEYYEVVKEDNIYAVAGPYVLEQEDEYLLLGKILFHSEAVAKKYSQEHSWVLSLQDIYAVLPADIYSIIAKTKLRNLAELRLENNG